MGRRRRHRYRRYLARRAMSQTPQAPWWALYALGAFVLAIFAGGLVASFAWGNDTQRTTMLTAAVTLAAGVAGYFYGSSKGSDKKDDTIASQAQEKKP